MEGLEEGMSVVRCTAYSHQMAVFVLPSTACTLCVCTFSCPHDE